MAKRIASIEYRKDLRNRILDVSQRLFETRGIRSVKMDDISAELGISKRTLYEIYPKKEELIFETIKRAVEVSRDDFNKRISQNSDTMDILAEFLRLRISQMKDANPCLLEEIRSYPKVVQFIEEFKEQHSDSAVRFYQKGQEEGYLRTDVNLALMADINRTLSDSFFALQRHHNYKPEDIFRTMINLFIRSICTPNGIARIDKMLDELV